MLASPEKETVKQNAPKKRLFPFNLTPFEDYMVWDDRPEYPMTFVVQMRLSGMVDRQSMEMALQSALEHHPLLQANVGIAKGGRDGWIAAADPAIQIEWGSTQQPIEPAGGEHINIRHHVGLRIWIRHDDREVVITTQFHHAACDGIGAYQFLGDWLWYYARRIEHLDSGSTNAEKAELPPLDPAQLRARVKASYDIENYRDSSGKVESTETRRFGLNCLRSVLPLAEVKNDQGVSDRDAAEMFPGIREAEFDKDTYKALRHVAQDRGQSVNELLIERLLVSMASWNEAQRGKTRGRFCVMMPMDLREPETRLGSAANLVTYALIRRKASECVESESLIDSIRQEMVHIKHTRHRTPFMNFIVYMQRWGSVAKWVAARRTLTTAILSNTGDPTKRFNTPLPREKGLLRAGNLLLQDITGVPPMRTGTRMTVSIFTYRRVLKICMRCDPHHFTPSQTDQVLAHYVASIDKLISADRE